MQGVQQHLIIDPAGIQFMRLNAFELEKRIDQLHNIQPEQAEYGGVQAMMAQHAF
ncbi:hypothetical protein D3C75_1261100 [compost metagenome]